MKSFCLAVLAFCIFSCNQTPTEKTVFVNDTTHVQDTVIFVKDSSMAAAFADSLPNGAYQGMYPCKGCEGIQQTILFTPDKKYRLEEGTLPDSASGAMDLFNNEAGIAIGRANEKIPGPELIRIVRDSVITGKMKIIRKGRKKEALDCEGNKIRLEDYKHQWNIPKCIVDSDFKNER